MNPERGKSLKAADAFEKILGLSTGLLAGASLMGSIAANQFEASTSISIAVISAAVWATICNQARGLTRGRLIRTDPYSLLYLLAAATSPGRFLILGGVMFGLVAWLLIIRSLVSNPSVSLHEGDRFYRFKYPLSSVLPLSFITPEPLSSLFDPIITIHHTPGILGLPIFRISLFDPQSLHAYLLSRGSSLSSGNQEWDSIVDRHRLSLRVLGLLEALAKSESINLDRTILTASARLALYSYTESARHNLIDALAIMAPPRRRVILDSFDLLPARA
jgi:hypothetical protein